ncbi:S-layer protein [Thermoanaerobacterium thermosaccharolyticum]|uniref:S-layer protein n=1 Tax=Thermoanaerobacterium thermosaccharolyticum TaxID=1517 RepID=A0A223HVI4_THETR|nr:alpha amylase family protein [Thermoanaerobacterium thermosaccharolyticum]AST56513.1 S-layer protein [Thermoanaerobacterium thermosaccharolyticum]
MIKNYYLWMEIHANKNRILNSKYFEDVLDKCVQSGISSIILSVKDTSGFCIYNSKIVPHYSYFDPDFEKNKDYLDLYINMAHSKNLKIYAAVDVFSEGNKENKNILSKAYEKPEWQTYMYGIDPNGNASIRPITDSDEMLTFDSIDDFADIFVNPVREDVQQYETNVIKEIATNYNIDGIVLDRVRFVGLAADFSDYTKDKFERFIGEKVYNWPEDIYKLKISDSGEKQIIYGDLFGNWITFRASVIKKFIVGIREIIKKLDKKVELIDYAGSWYPIYYQVGANWASEKYIPEDYPWVGKEYSKTGYAEYLDKLMSGFYYPDVTIDEAIKNGKPAYWYSVEGSGIMASKVTMNVVPIIGSLFVKQYEGNPENFKKAIDMCFKKSQGCMLFDLSYIEDYNWWRLLID